MLSLWEYFWLEADWAIANATTVTLTGPSSGTINTASSPFVVGANGSISGTLVVTIGNTGGIGVFSQSIFSLSSGAATGTFTYTPSTLGFHIVSETNNQGLIDATSLSYEVVAQFVEVPSTGGHGPKDETYHPAPDEFWEERAKYIARHIQPALDREKAALAPNAAEVMALQNDAEQLIGRQAELRIRMDARNTVLALAHSATSRRELEDYANRVIKLTLDISQLIADYYNRIAIILLLDIL